MQPSVKFFFPGLLFGDADFADSRVTADTGTAEEDVTDNLDADHIGRTGFGNGDTCREDDEVAGFDEVVVESCKDSIVDDSIGVAGFFTGDSLDAPVELQAADDGFMRRYGYTGRPGGI